MRLEFCRPGQAGSYRQKKMYRKQNLLLLRKGIRIRKQFKNMYDRGAEQKKLREPAGSERGRGNLRRTEASGMNPWWVCDQ